MGHVMPTGLKQTSSVIQIAFNATQGAPNAFAQTTVDLNLSPLDREVFVVLGINLDPFSPDVNAGITSTVNSSLTTTSQTAVQQLSNSNCLAVALNEIKMGPASIEGVPFQTLGFETPPAVLEYIGIIATNDFFVQVDSVGNIGARAVNGKMYGYRARATADIYAALVQSEVLSA